MSVLLSFQKILRFVSVAIVVSVAGLIIGCSDDDDDGGNIANGANDVWFMCEMDEGEEYCMGIQFRDGKVYVVIEAMPEMWVKVEAGTYTTRGNTLALNIVFGDFIDASGDIQYSVSGNTLSLIVPGDIGTMVFTKKTDLAIVDIETVLNLLCLGLVADGEYSSIADCRADIGMGLFKHRSSALSKMLLKK